MIYYYYSIYWVHNSIYWVKKLIYWDKSSIYWVKNTIWWWLLAVEVLDLCQVLRREGLDKLPPTQVTLHEHIRRAHYQCSIWVQALLFQPIVRPPNELGWSSNATWGQYMPTLIRTPIVPDSILQLIRCTCSKRHCVAHHHNLHYSIFFRYFIL